jgi:hypothetical protein
MTYRQRLAQGSNMHVSFLSCQFWPERESKNRIKMLNLRYQIEPYEMQGMIGQEAVSGEAYAARC